ncbi:MAG TPA: hypothetical protein VEI01_17350 [Terriglobales bacterium]|nr:hypothetical protein [Terriglobales bacterium]
MKPLLLTLMWLAAASAQARPAAEEPPVLTIYNQNFFVAREHLPLDLSAGVNHVEYAGTAAHLEPDSVILRDPAGRALEILEQNYRNDPISQELLLSFYQGKTIEFLVQPGQIIKGKIIRSGYIPSYGYAQGYQQPPYSQPIIEVDGVLRFGLPGQPLFPALSGDSILQPTLSWQLQTDKPGKFDAELSYLSAGMTWHADYNLVVSDVLGQANLIDLVGWITMQNQSGKTFENARIKLMAGDVNKVDVAGAIALAKEARVRAPSNDAMAPPVSEKAFDEFHLYTLERPATLRDQETKQVEFVRATGIHSQRLYLYDGVPKENYYFFPGQVQQDPNYGTQSNPKVWVMQELKNSEANHLGMPLPKGRLRFYRRDSDGHLEFVGENTIDHTPKDETLRLYTGNAFDVVGERKRTNFLVQSRERWMDESFEIRVRNHKKETVNLRVVEHLNRCNNWKLAEASTASRRLDSQTIEFPVTIKPDGEALVTYTVHYWW